MKVKLDDVIARITGNVDRFNTDLEYYVGGEHYDYASIAIYNKGLLKSEKGSTLGFKFHFPFKKGDTLFMARNPHLKKAGMVTYDGICSDASYVLRTKDPEVLLPEFLPLIIQNDLFWAFFEANKSGSVNYLMNWKEMRNYEFELPSIERQKAIADMIWAAERTRKAYIKLIEATDELVKSQFIEMFGDPEVNKNNLPIATLKDICVGKLSYGSGAAAVDYDGVTRYVRITDITDAGELSDDVKSPSVIDEKYLLNEGDVLFARSGATVGKTLLYREKYGRCIYAGFLIRLIPNTAKVLPDYVFGFTKSTYYKEFVKKTQRAVGQPNINAQEYGDLKICVPPIEQQKAFSKFLEQSDKSKLIIEDTENLVRRILNVYGI